MCSSSLEILFHTALNCAQVWLKRLGSEESTDDDTLKSCAALQKLSSTLAQRAGQLKTAIDAALGQVSAVKPEALAAAVLDFIECKNEEAAKGGEDQATFEHPNLDAVVFKTTLDKVLTEQTGALERLGRFAARCLELFGSEPDS